MTFPRNHLSSILGQQGWTISGIRKVGADVWVKIYEDKIDVNMTGSHEQVEAAKVKVVSVARPHEEEPRKERQDRWKGSGDWGEQPRREKKETELITLGLSAFGCIVGPGGATIKDVRSQSGAYISIDKLSDRVEVKISGTPEQVAKGKSMVTELAEGGGAK